MRDPFFFLYKLEQTCEETSTGRGRSVLHRKHQWSARMAGSAADARSAGEHRSLSMDACTDHSTVERGVLNTYQNGRQRGKIQGQRRDMQHGNRGMA